MGVVDLAVDATGQPVALKRLAVTGSQDELDRARARLRREAETLRQIQHPAVVPLLDVIDDGDDVVLVMPFLGGGSLADRVQREGPLADTEVLAIADRLLPALAAMHRRGIVHRDAKPANVLFDDDGRAFLTDFGVAALRDATSGLTESGTIVGTPAFIAPEQARGEEPSAAADVFALGATLYWAATGRPVYGDTDGRTMLRRAAVDAVRADPRGLDPRLARLLGAMLQPDPARRPSAALLAGGPDGTDPAALRPAPVPAPAPGPAPRTARAPRAPRTRRPRTGRPTRIALAFAAVTATAVVLVLASSPHAIDAAAAGTGVADAVGPGTTCPTQPYRRCGLPPAAHTDGTQCLTGWGDIDGDRRNGCEAAADTRDGTALTGTVQANLVPADDTDRYPMHIEDSFSIGCKGTVEVTLTAPAGTTMVLELLEGATPIGRATSKGPAPAHIRLTEPNCGRDDTVDLTATVRYAKGSPPSATPYTLSRHGDF